MFLLLSWVTQLFKIHYLSYINLLKSSGFFTYYQI